MAVAPDGSSALVGVYRVLQQVNAGFRRVRLAGLDPDRPYRVTGPDGAVMVGDRDNDVNGAKTCGIPCIGVSWGYAEPGELLSAGAIYLVETVDALENILLG